MIPEQRFILTELIKASKMDMEPLVEFVKANCVSYSWFSVQLPAGMLPPPFFTPHPYPSSSGPRQI